PRRAKTTTKSSAALRRHLGEELLARLVHFLRRHVLHPLGERPEMTVRILELTHAIAPELVAQRHLLLGAGLDGALPGRVHVLEVEPQPRRRRSLIRLRA